MRKFRNFGIVLGLFCIVLSGSAGAIGQGGMDRASYRSNDPPGRIFPGHYFEYKARFYLKKGDYRAALQMFELAGFWANKIAQYNAGIMYYNGIGVPVDRVRGVAWLGIAAEAHDDLADRALSVAYASLNDAEKRSADALWRQLAQKYGDAVSVRRALDNYAMETRAITGSHVGFVDDVRAYETGPGAATLGEAGSTYYARQAQTRDALISKITGHVTVGAVGPLDVPKDVLQKASQTPLE